MGLVGGPELMEVVELERDGRPELGAVEEAEDATGGEETTLRGWLYESSRPSNGTGRLLVEPELSLLSRSRFPEYFQPRRRALDSGLDRSAIRGL